MRKSLYSQPLLGIVLVILSSVIILAFTSCELLKEIAKGKQNSIDMKVVSFNILAKEKDNAYEGVKKWDERMTFVLSILVSTKADIIGLQEAVQQQHADLGPFSDNALWQDWCWP